jgi:hypothetical protein
MPLPLADQLGFDSIFRFERSAPMRLEEGDLLSKEHRLAAIYLYGYAAEMILKAAYFRNLRHNPLAEIERAFLSRAMAAAKLRGMMNGGLHDIAGWAEFLVWDKATLHAPAYGRDLSREIVSKAAAIYENWRPEMRYRNTSPGAAVVTTVRSATEWLVKNYSKM